MTKQISEDTLREWIINYLTDFLDLPAGTITESSTFSSLGLDSAESIMLGGALEEDFDCEVDAALFLRNANIAELIADLRNTGLVA